MIQIDKLYHFIASLILTIVLALVVKHFESNVQSVMCGIFAASVIMCLACVSKEVLDKFWRRTGFDWYDIIADLLGCVVAVAFTIFM